jgi:hypothetical protein
MTRSKVVAILTGAIAILLSVLYLLLVQLLDFRGDMVPAPVSRQPNATHMANAAPALDLFTLELTVGSVL